MFRFTREPSSGSYNQCLAKITGLVERCASVQMLSLLWQHILTVLEGSIWGTAWRKILIYDKFT